MTKHRETHPLSPRIELRPHRKPEGATTIGIDLPKAEGFVQAFADALRDILRDEGRKVGVGRVGQVA